MADECFLNNQDGILSELGSSDTPASNGDEDSSQKDYDNPRNQLMCNTCGFTAISSDNLKDHHNSHIYVCHLCDFTHNNKKMFKHHLRHYHMQHFQAGEDCEKCNEIMQKSFICQICNFTGSFKAALKSHVEGVHMQLKRFKCDRCHFRTYHKQTLQYHIKNKHEQIRDFQCHLCDYSTAYRQTLRWHIEHIHMQTDEFECHICYRKLGSKRALNSHIDAFHKHPGLACTLCSFKASSEKQLENHLRSVHWKYNCNLCSYGSKRKLNLVSHVKVIHTQKGGNKCKFCNYTVDKFGALIRHLKTFHYSKRDFREENQSSHSSYKCNFCTFSFAEEEELKSHIENKHSGERVYECYLCEFVANSDTQLEEHIQHKHGNKLDRFKCHKCDFSSIAKNKLKDHIESVHLNLKPYKCSLCSYGTHRRCYLEGHTRRVHKIVGRYLKRCPTKSNGDYLREDESNCQSLSVNSKNNLDGPEESNSNGDLAEEINQEFEDGESFILCSVGDSVNENMDGDNEIEFEEEEIVIDNSDCRNKILWENVSNMKNITPSVTQGFNKKASVEESVRISAMNSENILNDQERLNSMDEQTTEMKQGTKVDESYVCDFAESENQNLEVYDEIKFEEEKIVIDNNGHRSDNSWENFSNIVNVTRRYNENESSSSITADEKSQGGSSTSSLSNLKCVECKNHYEMEKRAEGHWHVVLEDIGKQLGNPKYKNCNYTDDTKLAKHSRHNSKYSQYRYKILDEIKTIHTKKNIGTKGYNCRFCKQMFHSESSLKRHFRSIHTVDKGLKDKVTKCSKCEFQVNSQNLEMLKVHLKERHGLKYYQCHLCNLLVYSKSKLEKHLTGSHEDYVKTHKCKECNYNTKVDSFLMEHVKNEHKSEKVTTAGEFKMKEQNIGKTYTPGDVVIHTTDDFLECSKCAFKVYREEIDELRSHMKSEHRLTYQKCHSCNLLFHSKSNFEVHLRAFHKSECFKCIECDYITNVDNFLVEHMNSKHQYGIGKPCEFKVLVKNLDINSPEGKNYSLGYRKCDICGYTLLSDSALKTHIFEVHFL